MDAPQGRTTPTPLARLLQARRRSAGYSRARLAELVDVPAGTIEGWEIGRVAKPPIHDVLRVARVLRIPVSEIEAAVLERSEHPPRAAVAAAAAGSTLLEQAIELYGWTEREAAAALRTSVDGLRARRSGTRALSLPEVMTVAALIALRASGGAAAGEDRQGLRDALGEASAALMADARASA